MRTGLTRRWSPLMAIGVMAGVFGLTFGSVGCRKPVTTPTANNKAASAPVTAQVTEIEDQLKSALYQLQPENLNIDARLDDAVSVLNNWWAAVEEAGLKPVGLTPPAIPERRVSEAVRTDLQRDRFDLWDGRAIRAAYLAKAIADQVTEGASSDLERIVRVFDWTCRNIALESEDVSHRPITLYELLVIGRGSPADRAWVMGAVLKQLRWDLVILHVPGAKFADPEAAWLAGVPQGGEIYLFDLRLGLPVPGASEPGAKDAAPPATLSQVLAQPELLQALAARTDQPFEPGVEQLQTAGVAVYSEPTSWSPRMWNVEQLLPGESLCVLYEAPDSLGEAPGVFQRVAQLQKHWSPEQVQLWSYPTEKEAGYREMDERGRRWIEERIAPFLMPAVIQYDREQRPVGLTQSMQQLRIRTDQLSGKRVSAIAQYMTIRQLSVSSPPEPSYGPLYQQAADDAFYWSSVCKYESGDLETAAKSLSDYLKRYRRNGRSVASARSLLADCLAAQGKYDDAVQTVRVQESDDPYRARHAVLMRRWTALAGTAATQPAAQASPQP
uniref:Tetratricopeptide repeat protein n=1 Tax=Schlesneria paludicola TaxID=360056 RepID=A0A7C2JY83_9PLAN